MSSHFQVLSRHTRLVGVNSKVRRSVSGKELFVDRWLVASRRRSLLHSVRRSYLFESHRISMTRCRCRQNKNHARSRKRRRRRSSFSINVGLVLSSIWILTLLLVPGRSFEISAETKAYKGENHRHDKNDLHLVSHPIRSMSSLYSGLVPRTIWISVGGLIYFGAFEFASAYCFSTNR